MARNSQEVLKSILIVVNECLGVLGMPRLNDTQCGVLIAILCGMARKPAPLQKPFNRRLLDVLKIHPDDARRRELARLLELETL